MNCVYSSRVLSVSLAALVEAMVSHRLAQAYSATCLIPDSIVGLSTSFIRELIYQLRE